VQARAGTQSIDRAAQLLVQVVESDRPTSVGELAQTTGLPKSTTSRLVGALERQGLLQRDTARASVRPGPVLVRFAQRGLDESDLVGVSAASLDRLASLTGETVNLAVATPFGVEQIDQRDSRHFLGSTNWVGRRVPYHCSAVGKVFLASGAGVLPGGRLERLTPQTIVDRRLLARELEAVRGQGYATAVGELEEGLWAVAAGVAGAAGIQAAISVSGPTIRLRDGLLDEVGAAVVEEASALSARLGNGDGITQRTRR
jgi:IclR family transcriptional regulator, acetate operon repressor